MQWDVASDADLAVGLEVCRSDERMKKTHNQHYIASLELHTIS